MLNAQRIAVLRGLELARGISYAMGETLPWEVFRETADSEDEARSTYYAYLAQKRLDHAPGRTGTPA